MKREIAATVRGDIEALLAEWKPPRDVTFERDADGGGGVIFSGSNLSRYAELEAAVARLAPIHQVTLDAYFRTVDLSPDDLRASELLWMRVPATPKLEVSGEKPVETIRCDRCSRRRSIVRDVKRVHLQVEDVPERPLIAAVTLKFASQQLLASLADADLNAGLRTIPCSLTARRKTLDDAFFFIAGTADLGNPQGEVVYGTACPKCGQPAIVSNRSFLWTFSRDRWQGQDFCTSSFFGYDMIYVSQRVYRHLESRNAGAIFEPIELI